VAEAKNARSHTSTSIYLFIQQRDTEINNKLMAAWYKVV
jgi:hypothetical protein